MCSCVARLYCDYHHIFGRPVAALPSGGSDKWLAWEVNDFGEWVRQQAEHAAVTDGMPPLEFKQFFYHLFGVAPPATLYVAQGAQFGASRAALRAQPLATYTWILEKVSYTCILHILHMYPDLQMDPGEGHVLGLYV